MEKTANIPVVSIVSTRHVIDLQENAYLGVKLVFMEKSVIKVIPFFMLKTIFIYFIFLFSMSICLYNFVIKMLLYFKSFLKTLKVHNKVVMFIIKYCCSMSMEKSISGTGYTLGSCVFHSLLYCIASHYGWLNFLEVIFLNNFKPKTCIS